MLISNFLILRISGLSILLFALLFSCKSEQEKCKFGTPVAIFSDTMDMVETHNFEAKNQEGNENVVFKNDVELQLIQSGCNEVKQEFRFTIPPLPEGDPNWILVAAGLFDFLGSLSPDLAPFTFWGDAIGRAAADIKLGETKELEQGFSVKIDRIPSEEKNILTVELAQ